MRAGWIGWHAGGVAQAWLGWSLILGAGISLGAGPELESRARLMFALGERHARLGRWEMAEATFERLVQEFPAHPQSVAAYRWLIAYRTSAEVQQRLPPAVLLVQERTRAVGPQEEEPVRMVQTRNHRRLEAPDGHRHRLEVVLAQVEQLAEVCPDMGSDPQVRLMVASARRQLGHLEVAEPGWAGASSESWEPWRRVIELEQWWKTPAGPPPRDVAWCVAASGRPHLDGQIDDECWQAGSRLTLRSADPRRLAESAELPTSVVLLFDDEFLYVGVRCALASAADRLEPVPRTGPDAAIDHADRIEIFFDVDRDYATYYRLRIDQRGLVADDCWGNASWNPQWFAASRQTDEDWQVEMAIPLGELAAGGRVGNQTWAVNVQRIVPGRGMAAWSLPAAAEGRPEGFGHLKFVTQTTPGSSPSRSTSDR